MRAGHEYAAHARELARRWQIRMVEDSGLPPRTARAYPQQRLITHAPITDVESYCSSLHEQGHIVHPNAAESLRTETKTARDKICVQLFEEEAAWQWARENALEWTPEMERNAQESLATYTKERDRLEAGGGDTFEDAMSALIDGIFMPGGPIVAHGPPPTPHDPAANARNAPQHRAVAKSIVESIRRTS